VCERERENLRYPNGPRKVPRLYLCCDIAVSPKYLKKREREKECLGLFFTEFEVTHIVCVMKKLQTALKFII
jgi:hypothetical protein